MKSIHEINVDKEIVNEIFIQNTPTYVSNQIRSIVEKYKRRSEDE